MYRVLALVSVLAVISLLQQWWAVPANWNPWAPLEVDHRMNLVTQWKLRQLKNEPEACRQALAAAPQDAVDYLALEDYTPVVQCPLRNVVRLRQTGVAFNAPFTVTCPVALTWLMFERQALQPLAQDLLGTTIAQVDHLGSFACRNIAGSPTGRRSQHASAAALDVAGFRLADGREVSVLEDWDNPAAPDESAFLQAVQRKACRFFGTVLGPEYNQAHLNHFHFDNSGIGFCR